MQARQGDVLIERVRALPANAKPQERNGRVVLADGEVTGHAHRVERADVAELYDSDRGTFLTVRETTRAVHEEHGPVTLLPGVYRVTRQREYAPDAIRNVAD